MTAKEMFEKLGYYEEGSYGKFIRYTTKYGDEYETYSDSIMINKQDKTYEKLANESDYSYDPAEPEYEELQAINQLLKELEEGKKEKQELYKITIENDNPKIKVHGYSKGVE